MRRPFIVVCVTASTLAVQGCIATQNTAAIGLREEKGVVTSPADMSVVGPNVIFHSDVVQTRALGGTTFSGETKEYRIVHVEHGRNWWASVDFEAFKQRDWDARSLQLHQGVVPSALLDGSTSESRGPADRSACYSLSVKKYDFMELITCDGKLISGAQASVTFRYYRTWWAYPSMIVAYPLAVAFDAVSFPLQLYAYIQWNGERSRW